MISAVRASNMSFQGTEMVSPRAAYENLIDGNRKIQEQQAKEYTSSLEHPTPPLGQGEKLDVIA